GGHGNTEGVQRGHRTFGEAGPEWFGSVVVHRCGADNGVVDECAVLDRAGKRAERSEAAPQVAVRCGAYSAALRFQSEQSAECRRKPDGTAAVAADSCGNHARRDSCCRAATRSSRGYCC